MQTKIKTLVVFIYLFSLTGCSMFLPTHFVPKPENTDYLKVNESPPLQLPPDFDKSVFNEEMPVPAIRYASIRKAKHIGAPGSMISQVADGTLKASDLRIDPLVKSDIVLLDKQGGLSSTRLTLDQNFASSWEAVGKALPKAGYKIVVNDIAIRRYFVLATRETGGKVTKATPIYQVHVKPILDATYVFITDNNGKKVQLDTSKKILASLQKGLKESQQPWYQPLIEGI